MTDHAPVLPLPPAVLAAAILGVPASVGFFGLSMFGSGLLALFFAVGIPFCLGYFSRQHWLIAALTYAGSFAISAIVMTYGRWNTQTWQNLVVGLSVLFVLFLISTVPSIAGAGLGALCRWCEQKMQPSQDHKEAGPSDAIQVGVQADPVRIEKTSHSSTSIYRRSRF